MKIFLTKFSIIVGVATFCVRTHAYRNRSVRLLSENEQKLSTKSARTLCPKPHSCIESANNHVEGMANRRQQKALKAEREARISLV